MRNVLLTKFYWIGFLFSTNALAALTITPNSPNLLDSTDRVYYATDTHCSSCLIDTAEGFSKMNLGTTLANDSGTELSDRVSSFRFKVSHSKTGSDLRMSVYIEENGAYNDPIPLVQYGVGSASLADCDATNCRESVTINAETYYKSILVEEGQDASIGFYLLPLCEEKLNIDDVCSAGAISLGAGEQKINIKFVVNTKESGSDFPDDSSAEETEITLSFPTAGPPSSCSSPQNLYFPGDGEIYINLDQISRSAATNAGVPNKILILGQRGSLNTTDVTQSNYSGFHIFERVGTSLADVTIGGFSNTSDGTDNSYDLLFAARDQAGILGAFDASCRLSGVQTAEVNGFLKEGNCFIATASFRDPNHATVEFLRLFRDQVLLKTDLGKMSVALYYRFSPDLADWLLEHPEWRGLGLFLLIPIQWIAFGMIHPGWFLVLVLLQAFIILGVLRCYRLKQLSR